VIGKMKRVKKEMTKMLDQKQKENALIVEKLDIWQKM